MDNKYKKMECEELFDQAFCFGNDTAMKLLILRMRKLEELTKRVAIIDQRSEDSNELVARFNDLIIDVNNFLQGKY